MASSYPSSVDTFATDITDTNPADNPDLAYDHASIHNELGSAVMAIENELGTSPSGAAATVASRLSTLDTTVAGKASSSALTTKADLSSGRVPYTQIPSTVPPLLLYDGSDYPARPEAGRPCIFVGSAHPVDDEGVTEVTGDIWIP